MSAAAPVTSAAAGPQGVSVKVSGKTMHVDDLTLGFLITNGQSRPFSRLFVLAGADKC